MMDHPHCYGSILSAGESNKRDGNQGRICQRDDWPHYALVYLTAGGGRYETARCGSLEVGRGDLLILFPGIAHRYGPGPEQSWEELYVIFEGPAFAALFASGLMTPAAPVRHLQGGVKHWQQRLQSFRCANVVHDLRPVLDLQRFLLDAAAPAEGHARPEWVQTACTLLQDSASHRVDMAAIATAAGLSYESFRKQFRQQTGESPGRYHARQLMRLAAAQLYGGKRNVKQVAAELGFRDQFQFSKRFHQLIGCPPSQVAG